MYVIPPSQIFDSACQLDDLNLEELIDDLRNELEARRKAPSHRIRLTIQALPPASANKVEFIKTIRRHTGLGLFEAKNLSETGGTIELEATHVALREFKAFPSNCTIEELPTSPAPTTT